MKYELDGEELSVLLVGLIGRRNNILGLVKMDGMSDSYYSGYARELDVVENLLEKFFPGSVQRIKTNEIAIA